MLKECNKFRQHQAREILIEVLESQLADRQQAAKELNDQIDEAKRFLSQLNVVEGSSSDAGMEMEM